MIARHAGGEFVQGGVYWSVKEGEFVSVEEEGGRLAGGREKLYLRAPLPVLLVVGPLMGLAFFIFLPLSGLLVLLPFLAGRVAGALSGARMAVVHALSPRTQPGVSFLEPQAPSRTDTERRSPPTSGQGDAGESLVEIAQEIADKRWNER